ncbi:phage antirepressor KilAC domain-containing protein [Desulfosporosinus nitroreducens]|uniref:phage antirepressor KilAC domain-containing protein n=1 Tax=Desulfosporosinus nitroreducens TaxID=2018668 RepID=UPI00207CAA53|nr:phage antirepressor KilAC domain-containing protein [Desulfosporosinus nitroreducens]MCO1599873.1 phage antirepressor KilAC domain-containing protein [Desulfosporosinus nitroreducens]
MSNLIPIEHKGQRILPSTQLADAYGTDNKHISENYINNSARYTEGKHFFKLMGEDLARFKEGYTKIPDSLKFASSLYLWTEKGAWLHAKSLNTDKAWEAYEMLVDEYYRIKDIQSKDSYMIDDPIARAKAWIIEAEERQSLTLQLEAQRPKVIFAEALEVSNNTILIGELAKILRQNGIEIGQNRLFEKLRKDGYLIKKGENYNQPTQYSMELGLFEIKKRTINNPDGSVRATTTTKVTGKGQIYFVNKLKDERKASA